MKIIGAEEALAAGSTKGKTHTAHYVFNNGSYIEGTWRRGDINESFTITDLNGEEVQIPPSTQWVHILPNEGEVFIDN